jgi:hypothetical protein
VKPDRRIIIQPFTMDMLAARIRATINGKPFRSAPPLRHGPGKGAPGGCRPGGLKDRGLGAAAAPGIGRQ